MTVTIREVALMLSLCLHCERFTGGGCGVSWEATVGFVDFRVMCALGSTF